MKQWIKKVFGFGLASFFSDFSHEMTVSLIPTLVTQFVGAAHAPLVLGIISSISDFFASFLRIFSGFISDRISRKKPLIAVGYAISAIFSTLVGFAHSAWGVLIYRMLSFTGSGLREPPRDALIAATVEPAQYGRAFGLTRAMDTLGALVGPLVAFACAYFLSTQQIFLASAIPGIFAVAAILFLTQDIKVHAKAISQHGTFLKNLFRRSPAKSEDLDRRSRIPRAFIIFLAIMFIFDISSFNKLLLLTRAQEMLSGEHIAQLLILLYACFNITRAVSELFIGVASDYINRVILIALFACGLSAVVALMLMATHATLLSATAIFVCAGASAAASLTLKKACAADLLPAEIRGLGYGIMQASSGFAALIANILIGFLWTEYSPLLGFSYVLVFNSIAMILFLIFATLYKKSN